MYILGIYLETSAVGTYRIIQPLTKVMEQGLASVHLYDYQTRGHDTDRLAECCAVADIVIIPRPHNEKWFTLIKQLQQFGKIVIIDHDDGVFDLSPWNPYYKYIGIKEVKLPETGEMLWYDGLTDPNGKVIFNIEQNLRTRDMIRACLKKVDALSVTTKVLADTFSPFNKNIHILPNLIDFEQYRQVEIKKSDRIRILWQGGHSHYGDIYLVKDVLRKIVEKNPMVDIVIYGTCFPGIFKDFPKGRVIEEQWVKYTAYPYKLALLNVDISIAPIEDTKFNINKTAIKYFELAALRIPTVASNISPYKDVIKDGENAYLASNEQEWIEKLQYLIDNKEARKNIGDKAFDDVWENHNADKDSYKWVEAYEKVLKGDIQ